VQRLIEQPVDEGDVREGNAYLGRVHYHLSVYRHFAEGESEPVPLHDEVEGRVTGGEHLDVGKLHLKGVELTLQLADGRLLDFTFVNESGAIRSTGRALYHP
jgi:hypothetical protein